MAQSDIVKCEVLDSKVVKPDAVKFDVLKFNLNKSSLIEASAGTGKTYSITFLVLRLLLGIGVKDGRINTKLTQGPLTLDEILIVSYTNAASADLKSRVLEKIKDAIEAFTQCLKTEKLEQFEQLEHIDKTMKDIVICFIGKDKRTAYNRDLLLNQAIRYLERAKRSIDSAAICTIHSFCNRALNQIYAFEASKPFASTYKDNIKYIHEDMYNDIIREYFYTEQTEDLFIYKVYKDLLTNNLILDSVKTLLQVRVASIKDHKHGNYLKTKSGYYFNLKNNFNINPKKSIKSNLDELLSDIKHKYYECKANFDELLNSIDEKTFADYIDLDNKQTTERWSIGKKTLNKSFGNFIEVLHECLSNKDKFCDLIISALNLEYHNEGFIKVVKYQKSNINNSDDHFYNVIVDFTQKLSELKFNEYKAKLCLLFAAYIIEKIELRQDELNIVSNDDVILRLDKALHNGTMGKTLAKVLTDRYKIAIVDEFQDTDPVQFSIFKQLYLSNSNVNCHCYFIGDPKQSIYEFRGSDINSYLTAKNLIEEKSIYTLNTNYRSYPSLIESVNAIFSSDMVTVKEEDNYNSFINDNINFNKVQANVGKYKFVYDKDDEDNKDDIATYIRAITKAGVEAPYDQVAIACAYDVLHILSKSRLYSLDREGKFSIERKIKPSDIAILVSKAEEFNLIKEALNSINIPCVYVSDQSNVLYQKKNTFSAEDSYTISFHAQNIIYLMEAMCYNKDKRKVLRALSCGLLCIDNADFNELIKEQNFEDETILLEKCHKIWENYGFLSAYNCFINDELNKKYAFETFFTQENGSRDIASYLHICELIQEYHTQVLGTLAQLRVFKDLCYAQNNEYISGNTRTRLDSQQDQINVITIHKSKGLEYPIVLLPFIFKKAVNQNKSRKNKFKDILIACYDDNIKAKAIDLNANSNGNNKINTFNQSQKDNVKNLQEEDRRLMYVALTRACATNFIYIGNNVADSSMNGILHTTNAYDCFVNYNQNHENKPLFKIGTIEVDDLDDSVSDDLRKHVYHEQQQLQEQATLEEFNRSYIDRHFSISSYSNLTAGQHSNNTDYQYDGLDSNDLPSYTIDSKVLKISPFDFPRGVQAGTFLHRILEHCNFSKCNDKAYISSFVDKIIAFDSVLLKSWGQEEDYKACLKQWLYDITHSYIYQENGINYSLCDLSVTDKVSEMSFLLPSDNLNTQDINELCKQSMQNSVSPSNIEVLEHCDKLYLDDKVISGFMTGSMDLVFRLKINNCDKYFVLDYKSNFIGPNESYYSQNNLEKMIFDNKSRYDVQYMIYTLALYRHLKARLTNFDYDTNVGGVIYLFLRGLKANQSNAVYHTKLKKDVIESLDKLCTNQQD